MACGSCGTTCTRVVNVKLTASCLRLAAPLLLFDSELADWDGTSATMWRDKNFAHFGYLFELFLAFLDFLGAVKLILDSQLLQRHDDLVQVVSAAGARRLLIQILRGQLLIRVVISHIFVAVTEGLAILLGAIHAGHAV